LSILEDFEEREAQTRGAVAATNQERPSNKALLLIGSGIGTGSHVTILRLLVRPSGQYQKYTDKKYYEKRNVLNSDAFRSPPVKLLRCSRLGHFFTDLLNMGRA